MNKRWIRIGWPPIAAASLILTMWQATVWLLEIESWLLPAPTAIWKEAVLVAPRIWEHTAATLSVSLIGLLAGVTVGFVIAIILHRSLWLRRAIYPLLILSQNIPTIVIAPLLIIWFGFTMTPKILIIILVCFFPIVIAVLDGFRQADSVAYRYLQMAGASKRDIFFKLELPSSLPALFSGLKIAATYSVMGAVISEIMGGSEHGLGQFMMFSFKSYRTDRVFVAIAVIALLSLLLFAIVQWAEKRIIRWKPPVKEEF